MKTMRQRAYFRKMLLQEIEKGRSVTEAAIFLML